jgi:hypothetical protein
MDEEDVLLAAFSTPRRASSLAICVPSKKMRGRFCH